MNLLLLLIATAGLCPIPTDRWAWLPLVALSALSVELQLVTLTHAGSLSSLVWLNLVFTAILLIVPNPRSRILSWMRNVGSAVRSSTNAAPRWAGSPARHPRWGALRSSQLPQALSGP